jgi:hypothetical protein
VRRRAWATAGVAALTLLAGCGSAPRAATSPHTVSMAADSKVCDGTTCISLAEFGKAVDAGLEGRVVGYTVLLGDDTYSGGWSRKDIDPPKQEMGPDVFVNSASIGKTFTAIVVLRSLARHGLTVDDPIGPYLPPDWVKGPGIEQVTFGQLLTHSAGFRMSGESILTDDAAVQKQVAAGVKAEDQATAVYNNLNFSIFRDLLPFMEGRPDPGPTERAAAADAFFVDTVQREVLRPAGVTDAVCAPVDDGLLLYPTVEDDSTHGQALPGGPQGCSPGGWSIRPADILEVDRALIAGNLLPADTRAQMDELGLGWDKPSPVKGEIVGKFGGFSQLQTFMGIVMGQVPLVMATNSDADTASLFDVIQKAFDEARVPA